MSVETQWCVLRVHFSGVHEVYERVLLWIENRSMLPGLLVRLSAGGSELLDRLSFAVSFNHKAGIVHLAVAGHSAPAAFDEVRIVDQVENGRNW